MLRPGGRLVLLVPAYEFLYNSFDELLGHYRRYTRKSLSALLQREGFSIVDTHYFNAAGIAGWWFSGVVLGKKKLPEGQLALYNRLVPFIRLADIVTSAPDRVVRYRGRRKDLNSKRMYKTLVKAAFFLLLAVYLADCFSPLRLHVDTVRYYAIKDCIEFGCPVTSDAATDYFPYGYTTLLLLFSKLGILKHFPIIFINVVYLVGGLYFLYKTFESKLSPYVLFVVVMLNWLVVKFTAHPLSELQYIFFSLGSVYFYSRFSQDRKLKASPGRTRNGVDRFYDADDRDHVDRGVGDRPVVAV